MRIIGAIISVLFMALPMVSASAQGVQSDRREVLNAFFETFNAHDVEAMVEWVSDDVRIIYVTENGDGSEVNGGDNLAQSMREYFVALPSAQSEILSVMVDGDHLAVRERASWTVANGEPKSQTALSVYQIRNGVISVVWYFPETRDPG
jgi:hypothetical protein